MSDGSWELQQAVFGLLDSLTPALASGGIHASAPQNQPAPYVEIGESDAISADVQCRAGLEETLTLHVWTKAGSQKLAKEIMSRIRETLHSRSLPVEGRSSALAFVRDTRLFEDADGEHLHGVVTLRVTHHGPKEA